jgi:translocation and assembly module TamB
VIVSGELDLDGLAVRSGQLTVRIPRADPLPIMFEGVTIADASGRLNIVAKGVPGSGDELAGLNVEVDVPRFHVTLPEQSPHDVQELDTDPTIVIGAHRGREEFRPIPLPVESDGKGEPELTAAKPLPVRVEIRLGDDVWIRRGTELEVKLVGSAVAQQRGSLSVHGELRLARGEINVQGRVFEIERGVITFVEEGDPANPTVIATAGYTAPEGTRVYAEFVGPVKTGKLSLRSEPPLRDDQILSLLLFGSPDGNFGTSTGGDPASTAALAAGGSVVTRGLNQELRKLTSLDIQTRIGEREGEPQPEVAVQISPRLTAELGYTVQAPNPGRSQDRTHVTLDLRLLRNWSLSTTIGDAGSFLLDLLWRHRY